MLAWSAWSATTSDVYALSASPSSRLLKSKSFASLCAPQIPDRGKLRNKKTSPDFMASATCPEEGTRREDLAFTSEHCIGTTPTWV